MMQVLVADIIAAAAAEHGISVEQLLSPRRATMFARPRQQAMYLARSLTDHSYAALGRIFGRDHSTVIFGVEVTAGHLDDKRHPWPMQIAAIESRLLSSAAGPKRAA